MSIILAFCVAIPLAIPVGAVDAEESSRLTQVGELDGAVVNNDQELMNYDGETITENLPKTTTGFIEENPISTNAIDDVVVLRVVLCLLKKELGRITMRSPDTALLTVRRLLTSSYRQVLKTTTELEMDMSLLEFTARSMALIWGCVMKAMVGSPIFMMWDIHLQLLKRIKLLALQQTQSWWLNRSTPLRWLCTFSL